MFNKIKKFFNDKNFIGFIIVNLAVITLCYYHPSILVGFAVAILFLFNIYYASLRYAEFVKVKDTEIKKKRLELEEEILNKTLPPYLVAFPSNERTISVRDINKSLDDENLNKVVITFRLVMSCNEIDKIDEYKQYIKDGMTDVLQNSPIYFQLTEEQKKKYQIYNLTK